MDAGLTLNANHSSDTITVFCEAGCGDALPEDKLRRDSLQPRSQDKKEEQLHTLTTRITQTLVGIAGSQGEESGEIVEDVAEEFSRNLLLSDLTVGVVVHDSFSTLNEQIPDNDYATPHETFHNPLVPNIIRSERDFVRYSQNHLFNSSSPAESHMYSLNSEKNTTSGLAAQNALNSFMKLASVRPVLADDVGAALSASSSTSEDKEAKRNSAFEERVTYNQYTFAFGGSMDPNQSLKNGVQLRKRRSNDSSKKGIGIGCMSSEDEINMPTKSSPFLPDALPVRKASLQRDGLQAPLNNFDDSRKEERKKSPFLRLKKKIRSFVGHFKQTDSAKDLSCSPHFLDPRKSSASTTSTVSSQNKKAVRFQDRVPNTFEPAFLSAPFGAASDRKSVLNSQFGQIQYNSISNAQSLNHSSSATNGIHPDDVPLSNYTGSGGSKSDSMADLRSFPSFAEARTGIYQRLKRQGKNKTEPEILPVVTLTDKKTDGELVKSVLPGLPTTPRLWYMDADEFEEHKVDTI